MNVIKKATTFFRQKPLMKALLIEAYLYLIISYILLRFYSFKNLSKRFEIIRKKRKPMKAVSVRKMICQSIMTMSRYTPWESLCYDRAIVAKWMLNKREIDNNLILGTFQNDLSFEFHAWIESDETTILNPSPKEHIVLNIYASKFTYS